MPIYKAVVRVGDHHQTRLVEAHNEAQVTKHLVRQHMAIEPVRTAEQIKDTAALAATGIKVETASAE